MLITHIIPGDLWAGAESQVYYTLLELNKISNHEVTVILFNKGELYSRLSNENISIHIKDENDSNALSICSWIKGIMKIDNPDIVHVHGYKSHILTSIAKIWSGSHCKIVRTMHGEIVPPFNIKKLRSFPTMKLEDILLRYYTACIIAVSRDIEHALMHRYSRVSICHISNAVHVSDISLDNAFNGRETFDIGEGVFWIGTAVRLVSIKNIDMLLNVATILKNQYKLDFRISIFGDGPLHESLRDRIKTDDLGGCVTLHGHSNDAIKYYKDFDVFVLTSISEGLPMSLLEAMSFATVPVCTRVGGMKEVITAECGFLVELNKPAEMAKVLFKLSENNELLESMATRAKARVKKEYSINKSVEDLLLIYTSEIL